MNKLSRFAFLQRSVLFILVLLAAIQSKGADLVWTNTSGGNWSAAVNWSPNQVPGAADNAAITNDGTYTLTVNAPASVNTVTVGGGSGIQTLSLVSGTFTINGASTMTSNAILAVSSGATLTGPADVTVTGALNWTGGTMGGSGRTIVAGGGTLSLNNGGHQLNRLLQNDGTATWTAGDLPMNGGTIQNNGSFTVNNAGTLQCYGNGGGVNAFHNAGTFTRQGAGVVAFFVSSSGVAFDNSGAVEVQEGTLALDAGGTHSSDFAVAGGATLRLNGTHNFSVGADISGAGSLSVTGGTITDGGTVNIGGASFSGGTASFSGSFSGGSSLTVNGGTVNFNGTAAFAPGASVSLSSGTLGGSADVTVTGALNWTGGTMGGSGRTIVAGGGTLSLNNGGHQLNRLLQNDGTATWTAGDLPMNGGTIQNNGSFTVNNAGTLQCYGNGGGVNAFHNAGTFTRQGAGVVAFFVSSSGVAFNNSGAVEVQEGTLQIAVGGISFPESSPLKISPGATLRLSTGSLTGATTNALQYTANGRVLIDGGGARQLEAMGRDVGNIAAGYTNNFAYGTLELAGSVNVTLVNNADNVPGGEALYVNNLIVPAGTTLNLGGIPVYARATQILGTVTGGSINLAPMIMITVQPLSQTVAPGGTATFSVEASGLPPLRYAWYKDSVRIAGATNATFTINNVQVTDVGRYSVRVSNDIGAVTSLPAELAVLDSYSLDLPAGYSLIANQLYQGNNLLSTVLPVVPNGTTLLKWNGAIQAFTVETYLTGSGWVPGTTTLAPGEGAFINLPSPQTLVFAGAFRPPTLPLNLVAGLNLVSRQVPLPGTYEQITGRSPVEGVIVDQYRPATGDYRTQVFLDGAWRDRVPEAQVGEAVWVSQFARPNITGQPASQTNVTPGSTVNFAVEVSGTPPLRYQWQRNGVSIADATNVSYTINNAQILDSGIYTAAVQPSRITPPTPQPGPPEDLPGAIISAPAALRFVTTDFPFSDAFGARPVLNTNAATLTGNNAAASVEAGEPSIAGKPGGHSVWLAWMAPANGIVTFITLGSSFDTLLAAYSGSGFPGAEVASDDDGGPFLSSRIMFNATAGQIYNIVVDGFGDGSGNFVLSWNLEVTAEQVPAILTQPQNQLVSLNGAAQFSVEATGANLTYQWFRDGQAVGGATSSNLIINAVQTSDVGVYIVQINSGARFVLSQPAQLQIVSALEDEPLALDKFQDVVFAATNNNALVARPGKAARKVVAHGFSGTQIFSSIGSSKEAGEPNHCGVRGGKSEWFSYQPTNNGALKLDTDGSNFDTVLAVYVGPGDSFLTLTNVACDNDSGTNGTTSSVLFNVTSNTIYYIAVDGVNNPATGAASSGRIQLNYRLVLPLVLTSIGYSSSNNHGRVIFQIRGTPGLAATVQSASSLSTPTWTSLFTNTAASGSFTYTNTNALTFPHRFYRVINRF